MIPLKLSPFSKGSTYHQAAKIVGSFENIPQIFLDESPSRNQQQPDSTIGANGKPPRVVFIT